LPDMPSTIDPARAALLVMDYQTGLLSSLDGADALLTGAANAIELIRQRGARVGYVRMALDDADLEAIPATTRLAARLAEIGSAIRTDSPATAIHDRVAPEPSDILVRKTRIGAFSTTDLDQRLRAAGIDTVILAGISTSGVVLSTLRDATDRDYRVVVLADACADPDAEVHDFLITRIFPRQADVVTIAELHGLMK
jgi:nicotinamidase-related amidase